MQPIATEQNQASAVTKPMSTNVVPAVAASPKKRNTAISPKPA